MGGNRLQGGSKSRSKKEVSRRLLGSSTWEVAVTFIKVVEVGPERCGWVHDMFCRGCLQDVKCNFLQRSVKLSGQVSGRP